ncbi:Flp pilus assembly protein CpaB [Aliiroseovarius sp.]|uniref:Flp pilus assembly protein CpaB n=1 Tax=Aliiroseovarius sp. TaxID=1872442 RepID=UPI003BA96B05
MRLIFGLVLVLGVALAGGAVYLAKNQMGAYQARLSAAERARAQMVKTVEVLVLTKALRYGDQVTAEDVRVVKWPEDAIPEGAFQKTEDLFPVGKDEFRTVLRAMEKDEAVLAVKVTEPGADAGVSARLSAGMRAFAIKVDVASGVSGFLRPGDRVDVYWTGRAGSEGRTDVTKLIEASLPLIAIDQTADGDRSSPTIARTVTVEATPRQVAALAQAQSSGKLSLALVGARDDTVSSAVEIDQNMLLGITEEAEVVEAAPEQACYIFQTRGTERIKTEIPCTN